MNESFGFFSQTKYQRIIIAALVTAIYGISLFHGFVWDDQIFFIGNPVYRDFDLGKILFSPANGVEYLPVRDLTYALDYLVWGGDPFGFHLSNLILFILNILLVHQFAALTGGKLAELVGRRASLFLPFAVAAGFALHPINAEVVNFITCRNVLVSALFVFLSCICMFRFLEDNSFKMLLAAFAAFILAMLGKATAIMLPLLFLFLLPILFPGMHRRIAVSLLPFFATSAGFFFLFKNIADKTGLTNTESIGFTIWRKIAIAVQIPFFYLKKLILPYGFSAEYAADFSLSLLSVKVIASVVAIIAIVTAAALWRKKYPEFTAGAVWFFLALLPVLNFFNTHPLVADRYLYLPTFGFVLVVASTIDMIRKERVKVAVFLSIGLFLSGMAVARSLDWRSDETLWKANIRSSPDESKGYLNLAALYFNNGQEQRAVDLLAANSNLPWLGIYLDYYEGKLFFKHNDLGRSKERFQKALDGVNGFVSALYFLGKIAEKEGDYLSAIQHYNAALVSDENDTYFERPIIKERLKSLKSESTEQYLSAMKQQLLKNPADLVSRKELAVTLDQRGFYEEALVHYLALERGGVKGWQIYHNIANCYFNTNRDGDAVGYYEQVIALGGGSEDTFNNLGIAYRKLARYEKSIQVLQLATQQFPKAPYPAFNLGITYFDAGEKEKARNSFHEVNRKFPEFKDRTAPYILKLAE